MARGSAPGTMFSPVAAAQCSQLFLLMVSWNELSKVLSFKISIPFKKFKSIDMFWKERTGRVYLVPTPFLLRPLYLCCFVQERIVAINLFFIGYVNTADHKRRQAVARVATCRHTLRGTMLFMKRMIHTHSSSSEDSGRINAKNDVEKSGTISKSYSAQKLCHP